jgi:methylated-DNA-[protein]-cysteine S-methyltransferase
MEEMTGRDVTKLRESLATSGTSAPSDVIARFAARAEAASLIDIAFTTYDAPFGPLVLAGTDLGLVRLSFDAPDSVVDDLSSKLSPRVLALPARFDAVRRQLDEYFAGRRRAFDVPIDLALAPTPFRRAVLDAAAAIPFGQTRSYADVARETGSAGAVRAVGSALGANPVCVIVPCHRVVRSDGSLSGYAGGPERKDFLLHLEGSR